MKNAILYLAVALVLVVLVRMSGVIGMIDIKTFIANLYMPFILIVAGISFLFGTMAGEWRAKQHMKVVEPVEAPKPIPKKFVPHQTVKPYKKKEKADEKA